MIQTSNLPAKLRDVRQWVGYMLLQVPDEEKPRKVPINPHTLRGASSNAPSTWGSIDEAQAVVGRTGSCKDGSGTVCGIGIMFAPGGGIVGVDLDHCIDGGQVNPWAAAWVERFNSYVEYSPSRTGLHILCLGALPGKGVKRKPAEMYDRLRFFTCTGDIYGPARPLRAAQEAIDALYEELTAGDAEADETPTVSCRKPVQLTNDELMSKALADEKRSKRADGSEGATFAELFSGDKSRYGSASDADQALANKLAFWTNGDAERIDRLFRQSALYRTKWDEVHGADTYGGITIKKAIRDMRQGYDLEEYRKQQAAQAFTPAEGRIAKTAAEYGKLNLRFIWYPYFPIGDYSVMMADGGTGKTIICCGLAAAVTTGKPLPGEEFSGGPRRVLIISGEDRGELLKVRLEASGADLSRVHILDCMTSEGMNFTKKYAEFEATVKNCNPALVIIDPWHGFVGPDTNINQVNELRPVLQKLAGMAKNCDCALLLISHVNKRAQGENANNAATGSNDLINASRSAVRIIFDEEDEDCRLMVHTKANYSRYGSTVKYRITDDGGVLWEGFSDITRATLELAARSRSTPGEVQKEEKRKKSASETLIYALGQAVDDSGPTKYTYAEFEERYGSTIFGGSQPKRALDAVKDELNKKGIFLKTGIQVTKNGKKGNGLLLQRHKTPTVSPGSYTE